MRSFDEQVGARVHMYMWDRRVTQSAVGAVLGIDQSGVSKKLRGKRPWLASDLAAIADVLGVAYEALLPTSTPPSGDPAPGLAAEVTTDRSATGSGHSVVTHVQFTRAAEERHVA